MTDFSRLSRHPSQYVCLLPYIPECETRLVNNLSDVYIGSDYQRILDLEKRVEQGILQRMKETGGFCLPDFVTKGVNIWFAVDNIDLLEDTPTGQNTFHGTVIVTNQRAEDGEPANKPITIPEKVLSQGPLQFEVKYLPEQPMKRKAIRFENYQLGTRKSLISHDYTHTWALANYFTTNGSDTENCNAQQVEDAPQEVEDGYTQDADDQQNLVQDAPNNDSTILSVKESTLKREKVAKEQMIPTWAATKSAFNKRFPGSCPY